MPQKLNKAGNMQNYIPAGNPAGGEYGDGEGSNKHFKSFSKPKTKQIFYYEHHPTYALWKGDDKIIIDEKRYNRFKDSANRAKNRYTYSMREVEYDAEQLDKDIEGFGKNYKVKSANEDFDIFSNELKKYLLDKGYDKDLIDKKLEYISWGKYEYLRKNWLEQRNKLADNEYAESVKKLADAGKKALAKFPKLGKEFDNIHDKLYGTNEEIYKSMEILDKVYASGRDKDSMTKEETKEYRKYTHNCQRCVQAFILRDRGYDVKAKPSIEGEENNKLKLAGWDLAMFIPKDKKGFEIHSADYYQSTYGYSTYQYELSKFASDRGLYKDSLNSQVNSIRDIANSDGKGATYIIQVAWQDEYGDNSRSGHVMVVKNEGDGKIMLYDPQTNEQEELTSNYESEHRYWGKLKNVYLPMTNLIRVDDLEINDNVGLVAEELK